VWWEVGGFEGKWLCVLARFLSVGVYLLLVY